jgi:hypothetical protein
MSAVNAGAATTGSGKGDGGKGDGGHRDGGKGGVKRLAFPHRWPIGARRSPGSGGASGSGSGSGGASGSGGYGSGGNPAAGGSSGGGGGDGDGDDPALDRRAIIHIVKHCLTHGLRPTVSRHNIIDISFVWHCL